MPNPRTTAWLAVAVAVCGLLLWTLQHQRPQVAEADASAASGVIFPHGFGDVESVIVEHGGFRTDLRLQGGGWRQAEPFAAEVDQVAVRKFLDALANAPLLERLTLEELRRRELQLKDFGLAPAQTRVVIRNAASRIELCFGNRTPDGGEVYLYVDTASQVLVTPQSVLDAVPVSLENIRDRALLSGGRQPVTVLELRRANLPFVKLARTDAGWQLTQPLLAPADAERVDSLLACLRQARIEAFIWPSGATNGFEQTSGSLRSRLALYGLDAESSVQVQFWEAGGPAGVRLSFGKGVDGHAGWIYALTADGQSVVAVTNTVVAALLATPTDLRDRRLFRETPDEVLGVQLRFADQLVECRRDEQRAWALVSPLQDAADQGQVERLLLGILRLRADHIVEPPAGVPERGVPVPPVCVLELTLTSQVRRVTLTPDAQPGWTDLVFTNAAARYVVATSNLPPAVLAPSAAYGLRDRLVMAVATASVRRVSVRRGQDDETVERVPDGDTWQVSGNPAGKAVSPEGLPAWLALCAALPAARIECLGAGARDLDRYGLSEPWMEIDVDLLSSEALRKAVLIGGSTRDGGRYAMLRGHDVIFVLGPETVRMLGSRLVQPVAVPAAAAAP